MNGKDRISYTTDISGRPFSFVSSPRSFRLIDNRLRKGHLTNCLRRLYQVIAAIAVVACVFITGCNKTPPAPPVTPLAANATDPQWIYQATPHAKVAVVFVHGIFGDTLGTWTNDNGESFFRLLKAQPYVGQKVDIFAFGFTSNMFKPGSYDIREAANKLHDSLLYKGVLDYPTVVFVAHSMGGLVVLRDLLTRRQMLDKVPLIVFYATPQEGAQIAAIAKYVANNPALAQMVPANGNDSLQQLDDEWKSLPTRPHVACAYEKLPTYGVQIVPWASATRFCDDVASPIDANHINIVKPNRLEHPSVIVLVNALNQYVVGKNLTAKLETPDFIPEGDHFVFHTSNPSAEARLVNAGGSKLTFTLAQKSDPYLYLTPDDTPRNIPARKTQLMHILLMAGAKAPEYRFILQSDVSPDKIVLVRVDNIAALSMKQAKLGQSVLTEVNAMLGDQNTIRKFNALPAEESATTAEAAVINAAQNAIARETSGLPESAQLVLAASVLNASNWSQLAAGALQQAEKLSPATAQSSSVRWLAGAIAAESGDAHILATIDTPEVKLDELPETGIVEQSIKQGQSDTLRQLAFRLKQVSVLKPIGFSLEGDISAATGNKQAAHTAYTTAESIARSPSLTRRITDLESMESVPNPTLNHHSEPRPSHWVDAPFRSGDTYEQPVGTDATQPERQ